MTNYTGKYHRLSKPTNPVTLAIDDDCTILAAAVRNSTSRSAFERNRDGKRKALVMKSIIPMFAVIGLFGCQSAQEQAKAADTAKVAATTAETLKAVAPEVAATKTPAGTPIVPTTAAEPAQKPAAPVQAVTEGMVVAAKAAFETNKCGTCHFVGAFPAVRPSTAKNDLGSVGITRSSEWIAGFLQKKEKLDGKFHIKTFAGTDAERDVLSQWLAAQKAEPLPMKPPGSK